MYTSGVRVPKINTCGTIYITWEQARRHEEHREIIQDLRDSGARDRDLPGSEMRWEYRMSKAVGPGIPHNAGWMLVLAGRAWHWWNARLIGPNIHELLGQETIG